MLYKYIYIYNNLIFFFEGTITWCCTHGIRVFRNAGLVICEQGFCNLSLHASSIVFLLISHVIFCLQILSCFSAADIAAYRFLALSLLFSAGVFSSKFHEKYIYKLKDYKDINTLKFSFIQCITHRFKCDPEQIGSTCSLRCLFFTDHWTRK